MVVINPEHTVRTLLRKYLFKIGKYNELGKNNLLFTYNNTKMYYNDKTKIKNFFKDYNVNIIVNFTADIIGG